jgi:hypothetical protein
MTFKIEVSKASADSLAAQQQIKTISGATRATGESLVIISDAAAIVLIFYLLLKAYFLRRSIYRSLAANSAGTSK